MTSEWRNALLHVVTGPWRSSSPLTLEPLKRALVAALAQSSDLAYDPDGAEGLLGGEEKLTEGSAQSLFLLALPTFADLIALSNALEFVVAQLSFPDVVAPGSSTAGACVDAETVETSGRYPSGRYLRELLCEVLLQMEAWCWPRAVNEGLLPLPDYADRYHDAVLQGFSFPDAYAGAWLAEGDRTYPLHQLSCVSRTPLITRATVR